MTLGYSKICCLRGRLAKKDNYWSKERKESHKKKCMNGGGSKRECMTRSNLEVHQKKCMNGGGCERGRMTGKDIEVHQKKCEDGGAYKREWKIIVPIWRWDTQAQHVDQPLLHHRHLHHWRYQVLLQLYHVQVTPTFYCCEQLLYLFVDGVGGGGDRR